MNRQKIKTKLGEWWRRYLPAEVLGTALALIMALITYNHTRSYLASAGAGFAGEGIGFYGYFLVAEVRANGFLYKGVAIYKRIPLVLGRSGAGMLVEFAPAEVLDSVVIRPLAMFIVPQYIKPYALGFLAGKLGADLIFYALAIIGYEVKQRWLR